MGDDPRLAEVPQVCSPGLLPGRLLRIPPIDLMEKLANRLVRGMPRNFNIAFDRNTMDFWL